MKLRRYGLTSLATLTFVGVACANIAHAQAVKFDATSDTVSYGLLNGNNLALYLNAQGDLGAPRRTNTSPSKPSSTVDPITKQPFVLDNGAVDTSKAGTYGALFSKTSTDGGSIGASVRAKSEYITVGPSLFASEGYSVFANGAWRPYSSSLLTLNSFDVSGNSINSTLMATSALSLGTLGITQKVTIAPGNDGLAKFVITFKNNSTDPGNVIKGLRYSRMVDPNQDATGGGGLQTHQTFGSDVLPGAFAINSEGSASKRHLGLGVLPVDPNADGTTIFAVDASSGELVLQSPDTLALQSNRITLGADGKSAVYTDTSNNTATTGNYTTDPFLDDFTKDQVIPDLNPATNNTSLMLLSPVLGDLGAGLSESFTFYYLFDKPFPNGTVPEPGTMSLLIGSLVSGGLFLRARRNKK